MLASLKETLCSHNTPQPNHANVRPRTATLTNQRRPCPTTAHRNATTTPIGIRMWAELREKALPCSGPLLPSSAARLLVRHTRTDAYHTDGDQHELQHHAGVSSTSSSSSTGTRTGPGTDTSTSTSRVFGSRVLLSTRLTSTVGIQAPLFAPRHACLNENTRRRAEKWDRTRCPRRAPGCFRRRWQELEAERAGQR